MNSPPPVSQSPRDFLLNTVSFPTTVVLPLYHCGHMCTTILVWYCSLVPRLSAASACVILKVKTPEVASSKVNVWCMLTRGEPGDEAIGIVGGRFRKVPVPS